MYSEGQIMSWYHDKIPRIQHGKRIYGKRYMTDAEITRLFRGTVYIQEKIDGKLSSTPLEDEQWIIEEDITGKRTVHDHVLKYKTHLPRIQLDIASLIAPDMLHFEPFNAPMMDSITIAILRIEEPTVENIHRILDALSRLPSNFGLPIMEGLVIKNYPLQMMGKWVNEQFEDKIEGQETKE